MCGFNSNADIWFKIVTKMDGGEEPFFFCDSHETFIIMAKFSMDDCPQMRYELFVQKKEGHILSYHGPKRPKALKKINFFIFQGSSFKTNLDNFFLFLNIFLDEQLCGSLTAKTVSKYYCRF